jgi:hypothetical protein
LHRTDAAVGHGTNAAKVLAHHEQRALAVFDGVFRFGKLGRCRRGNSQRGSSQGKGCNDFHVCASPWVKNCNAHPG